MVPMNGLQTEIIREMECVLTSKKENADEERNVSLNIQMRAKKRQKSVLILKKENVIVGTIASLVMTQIITHHGVQSEVELEKEAVQLVIEDPLRVDKVIEDLVKTEYRWKVVSLDALASCAHLCI